MVKIVEYLPNSTEERLIDIQRGDEVELLALDCLTVGRFTLTDHGDNFYFTFEWEEDDERPLPLGDEDDECDDIAIIRPPDERFTAVDDLVIRAWKALGQ